MDRLFLAVRPAAELVKDLLPRRDALRAALPDRARARWSPPEGWHLTLHFLGDVPAERLPTLERLLTEGVAGVPRHRQPLDHFFAFPDAGRARVSGLGGAAVTALADLHARLRALLEKESFPTEERDYYPHLTFVRLSPPVRLPPLPPVAPLAFPVEAVTLYRSAGGRYEILRESALA